MQYERITQRGRAWIIDNRDGGLERIGGAGVSLHEAYCVAYASAASECCHRNSREGWQRFVAVTERAANALLLVGNRRKFVQIAAAAK